MYSYYQTIVIVLQEAFFGRELLDVTKESTQELESSSEESDNEKSKVDQDKTISLSQVSFDLIFYSQFSFEVPKSREL